MTTPIPSSDTGLNTHPSPSPHRRCNPVPAIVLFSVLVQSSEESPYQPLPATQPPINPPYMKACMLKKTNQLDRLGVHGDQSAPPPLEGSDIVGDMPGLDNQSTRMGKEDERSGDESALSGDQSDMQQPTHQQEGVESQEQSRDVILSQVTSSLDAVKM